MKILPCQSKPVKFRKGDSLLKCIDASAKSQGSKNQVNRTGTKEMNKAPITDPKEVEIYDVSDTKFKRMLSYFSKLQEYPGI